MAPDNFRVMAAWFVGEGPHLLRPLLGLSLRSKNKEWGVIDEHGVAVCCAKIDGALRTCHDTVKHTIARSAVDAGFRVEVEVYGVFTRALREADRRRMDAYSVREKQGLVPDLQIDDPHYELKGIRVDSSNANYNGGLRSTGYSTGVAKKELNIIKLMTEKAAKLDRDTFGVDGAHGPWQQRLAEIGGIKPLAFGQFGEMGPGLEALLASVAKRGADEMADRYLIENREAAVGVQVFHVRQRWGAAIWRAQTQVLLGRLKYALPGWEEAESRRAADTAAEASCRSHASGSGARGFDAGSWGAGYGGDVGRADRY